MSTTTTTKSVTIAHQRVSPAADTLDQVVARLLDTQAREAAVADRQHCYPTVTVDNAEAILDYHEARVTFHRARLDKDTTAKSHADIEARRLLKARR